MEIQISSRIQGLLKLIVAICTETFQENLTGVYLHGSLAMGCFQPKKSDVDFLVILRKPVSFLEKKRFMEGMLPLERMAPEKGLEMSMVLEKYCRDFIYPTPFELHYSRTHRERYLKDPERYLKEMQGTDKDLAAHFMVVRERGKTLFGEPLREVFEPVSDWAYLDSIREDAADAEKDLGCNPVYYLLNICRITAWIRERKVLSKKEGGEWGLAHFPEKYHEILHRALRCYCLGTPYGTVGDREKELLHLFSSCNAQLAERLHDPCTRQENLLEKG